MISVWITREIQAVASTYPDSGSNPQITYLYLHHLMMTEKMFKIKDDMALSILLENPIP